MNFLFRTKIISVLIIYIYIGYYLDDKTNHERVNALILEKCMIFDIYKGVLFPIGNIYTSYYLDDKYNHERVNALTCNLEKCMINDFYNGVLFRLFKLHLLNKKNPTYCHKIINF